MSIQKTKTEARNDYNSFETALVLQVDTSELSARNARNKYTERKHWIEFNKNGYRYCTASFDSSRNYWCAPKKGTYSHFKAMVTDEVSQIGIIGFSRYAEIEEIERFLEKYEFCEHNTKYLTSYLTQHKRSKAIYEGIKEEAEETFKQTRKTSLDFEEGKLYTKDEITKCTSDLKLIKLYVSGQGVKKRCRKEDYFNKDVAYYVVSPLVDLDTMMQKSIIPANETIAEHFKSTRTANLTAKNVTYKAPTNDSMFYGMSEMLMSSIKTVAL